MADPELNFTLQFKASEQSLKTFRKDFEKSVKDLPATIKSTVEKATSGSRGGLVSGISKLTGLGDAAQKRVNSALEKRAQNLEVIAFLESKNAKQTSLAEVGVLTASRKSAGGFNLALKNAIKAVSEAEQIGPALNLLLNELGVLTTNVKKAAGIDVLRGRAGFEDKREVPDLSQAPVFIPGQKLKVDFEPLQKEVVQTVEKFKDAGEKLKRFRERLDGIQSIGGIDQSFTVLDKAVKKNVFILENAATSAPSLADDLRAQAAAVGTSVKAGRLLTSSQLELVVQLKKSADGLGSTFFRPIEAVGDRARDLAIRFGSVANDVARALNPNATRQELKDATARYRDALDRAGGNIARASELIAETEGGDDPTVSRRFVEAAEASLDKQSVATVALADSSKQLANAQNGLALKIIKADAITEVNQITKEFNKVLKIAGDDFKGAGREAGNSLKGFSGLQGELNKFKNDLFSSVDPSSLQGLKDIGINVDEILEKFITKAGENFVKEFGQRTDELSKDFLKLDLKDIITGKISLKAIEAELVRRFGKTGQQASDIAENLKNNANKLASENILKESTERKAQAEKSLAIDIKLAELKKRIISQDESLIKAISDSIKAERLSAKLRGGKGGSSTSGPSGPTSAKADDLASFGSKLNTRQQEIFVSLLQKGEVNLKKVNTQLKAHQGNIAKSNNLVDDLTRTMTSGQKAAFQFGFAAANAAERLAAWASPAAFIFAATSSLKAAVSQIIQLDSEIARIAFFDGDTLDKISAGIEVQGRALLTTAASAEAAKGAFDRLNTSTERLAVLNLAAARSQLLLIDRAKETGVELNKLAEIALVAGRVGKQAFDDSGTITPFAQAVEGAVRLEGANANAADITAKLNSVLNQFGLEAQDATVLVAQLTEASRRTAFGVADLAEGLTRVAGAFSTLQRATPAQTLEFLATAGNTAQVSVSKVGTALRQFSVGVAKAADGVKEFSGLDIVDTDGLLRGPEALVEVLRVINTFEGSEAAIQFIKQFTDERNASIILSLARGTEGLSDKLAELAAVGGEAAAKQKALLGFLAAVDAQSLTLESQLEKVRASVTELVATSGFIDFLSGGATALKALVGGITTVSNLIGGFSTLFTVLAGAALPTLQKITQGFFAGLTGKQQLAAVQSKFVIALTEEKNLVQAINIATAERLITQKAGDAFISQAIALTSKRFVLEKDLLVVREELLLIDRELAGSQATFINKKNIEIKLEAQLLAIKREEAALSGNIGAGASAGITRQSGAFGALFDKTKIANAVVLGVAIAGPIAGKSLGKAIGGEAGKELEGVLSGLGTGLLLGSIFGPVGALLGGLIGAAGGLLSAQEASAEEAAKQLKTNQQLERSIERQKIIQKARTDASVSARKRVSDAQFKLIGLQNEQETLQIRITAATDNTSSKNALLEKSKENQVEINRLLLQQKKLEAAQVERQLTFEQRIVELKTEQTLLTKTNNLLQKAEIALLDDNKNKPILEVQIKADTDIRNLAVTRDRIQKSLDTVELRLLEAGNETGSADTVKKLSKQQKTLQGELLQLDIQRANTLLDSAIAVRDIRKSAVESELSTFKSIGSLLRSEFKSFTDNQLKIVDVIGKQASVFKDLAKNEDDLVRNAARARGGGGANDISDLSVREQLRIIRVRNRIIEQGARASNRVFREQLDKLGDVESLDDLGERAKTIADEFSKLGGPLGGLARVLTDSERAAREELDTKRAGLDIEKQLTLKSIDIQRQRIAAENGIQRQRIALINEEINVLRKRIDLETKIGEKLILTPEKFFDETRKALNSKNLLEQVGANEGNIEESLLKIIRKVGGTSGIAGLKPIFEGLKAAEENGQQLIAGVLPKELASLFARLVANPNAKLQEARKTQQEQLIGEIGNLLGGIKSNNQQLIELVGVEKEIRELQKSDDSAEKQLEAISTGFKSQKAAVDISIEQLASANTNLRSVAEKVETLREDLIARINVTEGDLKIETAVKAVRDVLIRNSTANEGLTLQERTIRNLSRQLATNIREGVTERDVEAGIADTLPGDKERTNLLKRLNSEFKKQKEELRKFAILQKKANAINRQAARAPGANLGGIIDAFGAIAKGELVGGGTLIDNNDVNKGRGVVDLSAKDKKARDVGTENLLLLAKQLQTLEEAIEDTGTRSARAAVQAREDKLKEALEKLGVDVTELKSTLLKSGLIANIGEAGVEPEIIGLEQKRRAAAAKKAAEERDNPTIPNNPTFVFTEPPEFPGGEDFVAPPPLPPKVDRVSQEPFQKKLLADARAAAEARKKASFIDDDGNRVRLGSAKKAAAEEAAILAERAKREAELDKTSFIDPDGGRTNRGAAQEAALKEIFRGLIDAVEQLGEDAANARDEAELDKTSFIDPDGGRTRRGAAFDAAAPDRAEEQQRVARRALLAAAADKRREEGRSRRIEESRIRAEAERARRAAQPSSNDFDDDGIRFSDPDRVEKTKQLRATERGELADFLKNKEEAVLAARDKEVANARDENADLRKQQIARDKLVEAIIKNREAGRDFGFKEGSDDLSVINPLARQIAAMERILDNGRFGQGDFDENFLNNLEKQLGELIAKLNSSQGEEQGLTDLNDARDELFRKKTAERERDTIRTNARRQVREEIEAAQERSRREERDILKPRRASGSPNEGRALRAENKENAKKIIDSRKETEKKQKENADKVSGSVDDVASKVDEMSKKMIEAIGKLSEALNRRTTDGSGALLKIDEGSREAFCLCIKEAIEEAMQNWTQQFKTAIEEGTLDVRVAPVELQLLANITSIIEGQPFAEQLVEALVGTGLEGRVEDIKDALAELLSLERDRSGNIGTAGANVLEQAGSTNKTSGPTRIR